MNQQLVRYQVYLNPQDVSVLTRLAHVSKVSRSQIIRDATKAVADRYLKMSRYYRPEPPLDQNPLLRLIGIEKSRTGTVGLHVDDIYRT